MENINKSFVMTAALPSSVSDLTLFNNGIKEISSFGYNTVEFYVESSISADVKQIISEYKMHTVFLAAGYQKKNQISLCSLNEFAGALQPVDRRKAGHATEINLPV